MESEYIYKNKRIKVDKKEDNDDWSVFMNLVSDEV